MTTASLCSAVLLDRVFGEPRRAHPLVTFGSVATGLEQWLRRSFIRETSRSLGVKAAGAACWSTLVVVPTAALSVCLTALPVFWQATLSVLVLYLCIGNRSLAEHAEAVRQPLAADDLAGAREQVAMIVSRDTQEMNETAVASAAIESVLENGSDAVLAPLLWFVIAGAPGALCYRLVNTLDAMWGYRNERYRDFGYVPAVADDLMNRPAAALTAIAYALCGRTRQSLHCAIHQASACDSLNAGAVMAAGAGALGIRIGGGATYGGTYRSRPELGQGRTAQPVDITRALQLLWRAIVLVVVAIAAVELLLWM